LKRKTREWRREKERRRKEEKMKPEYIANDGKGAPP
jgi:hypothetical protein